MTNKEKYFLVKQAGLPTKLLRKALATKQIMRFIQRPWATGRRGAAATGGILGAHTLAMLNRPDYTAGDEVLTPELMEFAKAGPGSRAAMLLLQRNKPKTIMEKLSDLWMTPQFPEYGIQEPEWFSPGRAVNRWIPNFVKRLWGDRAIDYEAPSDTTSDFKSLMRPEE